MATRKRKRSQQNNSSAEREEVAAVPILDFEQLLFADLNPAIDTSVFGFATEFAVDDSLPSLAQELAAKGKEQARQQSNLAESSADFVAREPQLNIAWQEQLFKPSQFIEQLQAQIALEFQQSVETGLAKVTDPESEILSSATSNLRIKENSSQAKDPESNQQAPLTVEQFKVSGAGISPPLQDSQTLLGNLKGMELLRLELVSTIYDFLTQKFNALLSPSALSAFLQSRGLLSFCWQQSPGLGVEARSSVVNQDREEDLATNQLLDLWLPTANWSSLAQLPSLVALATPNSSETDQDLVANSEYLQMLNQQYQVDLLELTEYLEKHLSANTLLFLQLSDTEHELIKLLIDYSDPEQYCSELEQINYLYFKQLPIFNLLLQLYANG